MYLWRAALCIDNRTRQRLKLFFILLLTACCGACHTPASFQPEVLFTGLSQPASLVFDNYGHLYVAESGTGRVLALQFETPDSWVFQEGFDGLSDLAVGQDNVVYAAAKDSSGLSCVYALAPQGGRSLYCGQLEGSCGLSMDRRGRLLIAESDTGRVLRVRENGGVEVLQQGLPSPKRVLDMLGMLVFVCDSGLYRNIPGGFCEILKNSSCNYNGTATRTKDGSAYVLDTLRNRLLHFDARGALLVSCDCDALGLHSITALACDRDGGLYAATSQGAIVFLPRGVFKARRTAATPKKHG